MKSQHRHELETNVLAKRMANVIEKSRPYGPTILGVLVAIVIFIVVFSYLSSSSAARQREAWSQYFAAVETPIVDEQVFQQSMQLLKLTAEEHADTPMQQWADITWADGQLWFASRVYFQNRETANEALSRATSVYKSLLRTSSDQRMIDRANFGLARIYEMQNDLKRAKDYYALVHGGFSALADMNAKQIDDLKSREELEKSLSWLLTAKPPVRPAPVGPGTPGQQPEFSAGDMNMPAATANGQTPAAPEPSIDDIINRFEKASQSDKSNRYDSSGATPSEDKPVEKPNAPDSPTSD
jgi:hypothetical protein